MAWVTGDVIITLVVAHLLASIATAEVRNLKLSNGFLCVQSLLLSAIIASFAVISQNPTLY